MTTSPRPPPPLTSVLTPTPLSLELASVVPIVGLAPEVVAVVGLPPEVVALVGVLELPGDPLPVASALVPPVVVEPVSVPPEDASPSPESHAGTRRTKEAKEIQRRCIGELEATPSAVHARPPTCIRWASNLAVSRGTGRATAHLEKMSGSVG